MCNKMDNFHSYEKMPFLQQRTCMPVWSPCSFILHSLLIVCKQLPPPFPPICHLSSSPLSRLSRPCAVMAPRLVFKCLLPKGHSRACLLITKSLSPSPPPNWSHSHDRVKVAPMLSSMPSISEGVAKLPLTLYFVPVPFLLWVIHTHPLQTSYPLRPLPLDLEVDRNDSQNQIKYVVYRAMVSLNSLPVHIIQELSISKVG